jgi:hypothetical protein
MFLSILASKYILRSSFPAHVTSIRVHTAWEDFFLGLSVFYFTFTKIAKIVQIANDLFVLRASFLWLVDVRLDLEVLGCWIYKWMTFCWPRRNI